MEGTAYSCDAFLSHRRREGAAYARAIKQGFERRERHAFLDVDERQPCLRYDRKLLSAISSSRTFVLLLTPGALDSCTKPDDWLRKEICHALRLRKNIVPVMLPDFHWPSAEELPEDIRGIALCEGLRYSHDYFEAFIEQLIDWCHREPGTRRRS